MRSIQEPGVDKKVKKVIRTLQSELPFLKGAKDNFYRHTRRFLHRPHESDFKALALIPDLLDGCYVDVGANHGQSIESIRLVKPQAKIVSFEANPLLAARLVARYKHNKSVRIMPQGLSDSSGHLTLFVPIYKGFVYDGLASLDRKAATSWISGETVLAFSPAKLSIEEVACQISTLDSHQLAPVFVKVDVQGYEFNVLNGGRETLRRYEPVLLIEEFGSDSRTVRLAEELKYEEYYFDGANLQKGSPTKGDNSFLVTPGRMKTLFGRSHKSIAIARGA
jgi:FkbM family methyltransferase